MQQLRASGQVPPIGCGWLAMVVDSPIRMVVEVPSVMSAIVTCEFWYMMPLVKTPQFEGIRSVQVRKGSADMLPR